MNRKLKILQLSTCDKAGGAEKVAYDLFQAYSRRGHESYMAVAGKKTDDNNVLEIPNDDFRNSWPGVWRKRQTFYSRKNQYKAARVSGWLANLGELKRWREWKNGIEDFNFPATHHLLDLIPFRPDVIHAHNLHGGYFDLRALPALTKEAPVILTLHDEWTFTGHCSYTLDCDRWTLGCGSCPYLETYPAIRRDATAYNLQRKLDIYSRSRLYVASPSKWLLDKAIRSVLKYGMAEARLIPNGVDLALFCPTDKMLAKQELGLEQNASVVLFVGNRTRSNRFKDYSTIEEAVNLVASRSNGRKLFLLSVGEKGREEQVGSAIFRFIEYQSDPRKIAKYYQAADVFLHAAHADNFPITVLESLACGTPVVATAVGGITEQVDDAQTGFLTPEGDAPAMAERALEILLNDDLRRRMGESAVRTSRSRFDLQLQIDAYLDWYQEILERHMAEMHLSYA